MSRTVESGTMNWLPVVTEDRFRQMVGDEVAAFLPPGHPGRGQYLMEYGERIAAADLNQAIKAMTMAVSVTAPDDAQRVRHMLTLAYALDRRYDETKSLWDLNKAVEALDVATSKTYNYSWQVECQDLLVRVLKKRYDATQSVADLNWAISALELVVDHTVRSDKDLEKRQELLTGLRIIRRQAAQPAGRIVVHEAEFLGQGSNGTMVYGGTFDGRAVAVKRVLLSWLGTTAVKEIDTLRKIDGHPNVVRYYYQEVQSPFHCIALDRCQGSLDNAVAALPADRLPQLLQQIALGLHHLHAHDVVHRDLKPSNILLRDDPPQPLRLVLSDFGLAKSLDEGQSLLASTVAGTIGWRAPELLDMHRSGSSGSGSSFSEAGSATPRPRRPSPPPPRTSKKNDIFSLGLVFYYVLTRGRHPFGRDAFMRDARIREGNYRLDRLDEKHYALARHLIASMLHENPALRPSAATVLAHPFFWDAERQLKFLCEASDDLEPERRAVPWSVALAELEGLRQDVFGHSSDFLARLPPALRSHVTQRRRYDGRKLQELLRMVRNLCHHYSEQPEWVQRQLGPLPSGFLGFWTTRFPHLVLSCWSLSRWQYKEPFAKYYMPATHA